MQFHLTSSLDSPVWFIFKEDTIGSTRVSSLHSFSLVSAFVSQRRLPPLAFNLPSSCLSFPDTRILGVGHNAELTLNSCMSGNAAALYTTCAMCKSYEHAQVPSVPCHHCIPVLYWECHHHNDIRPWLEVGEGWQLWHWGLGKGREPGVPAEGKNRNQDETVLPKPSMRQGEPWLL